MDSHSNRNHLLSNQTIKAQRVRLIDENGVVIGIVSLKEALELANQKNLDLIEMVPDADPPVCKIADYGRLRYKSQKKKTELRRKRKVITTKEIQLRPSIQEHDYQVKLNRAKSFLEQEDKLRIVLQFRGRELSFVDNGYTVVRRMIADLESLGKPESNAKLEGRRIAVLLSPIKKSV